MTEPTEALTPTSVPRSRIAHAFSVQLICRVLGMLASVVSVAMTARYLGPGRYGELTIAVAFIGMWTSLANLGVGTVIVRRVSSGTGDLERLVRINSGLSLVYCVPLASVAAVSGLLIYSDADVRVMLVVLSGQLLMLTMTTRFEPVFMSTVRFAAVAVSDVVSRVATLGAVCWLVTTHADVIWFAVAQLIPPALQLLIQGTAAARHISLRPVFAPREAAELLRESLALMGVMVVGILYWRADGVILSLVSTHAEVGVYGLAYTVAFNTEALSVFFLKSTLSTATGLFSRDVPAFAAFQRHSVEMMYFLAAPVAVVGAVLAGPLIGLLGDQAFVGRGAPTLGLLFIAAALRFVTSTVGQGLFACHQQRYFFRAFVVTLVVNVAMNFVLDYRFGAVGAGVTLVCTELMGLVLASRRLRRECGYRTPVGFLLRLAVPTGASVAVALLLSGHHVVLVLVAAAAAYFAVNLVAGPVNRTALIALFRKQVSA
ncbi:MAG: oligosaccharide flippase family protein [Mycobacterium sp.]|uniref:oligosaccharide flippase family protein n=1 Tax=Mycobacterium sp. TaxID=1785 RepID=UPI001EB4DB88|nr:oligosaccharide flippase family protein [Mycobacterium sp.]MBW0016732.1 oligosaccharide flippase family protein [Mycobacterium sp.]